MSASDAIHPWHAFTKFTARGCGKNTTSESGSGAVAARRRNKSRPSVLALLAVIPRTPAASSLRYRSRRGGSGPNCATQSVIAREISGASRVRSGTRTFSKQKLRWTYRFFPTCELVIATRQLPPSKHHASRVAVRYRVSWNADYRLHLAHVELDPRKRPPSLPTRCDAFYSTRT
jgi:hypothetical protein